MTLRYVVLGGTGLVGSAITRELLSRYGPEKVWAPNSKVLDLSNQSAVIDFFLENRPPTVINAAARVGGIGANSGYPFTFVQDNLEIQTNVFKAAAKARTERMVFMGSSCIYPAGAPQPIKPDHLLTGPLEPTNEPYAVAKISGLVTVKSARRELGLDWISLMPTNMYGPGDNYRSGASHVLPALIRRYSDAVDNSLTEVTNWGSGRPLREFLHVDDLASATLVALDEYHDEAPLNIGSGEEVSIQELATLVSEAVGFKGETRWDTSRPDGVARKLLDSSIIRSMGWSPAITLEQGLQLTVQNLREDKKLGKARL